MRWIAGCLGALLLGASAGHGQELGIGARQPELAATGEPRIVDLDLNPDFGLDGAAIRTALSKDYGDRTALAVRGRRDVELYRTASPSVVVVVTNDGIGSGVYLGDNKVVTNWHVIQGAKTVGVLFKPVTEGATSSSANLVRSDVVRTDPRKDLALLKVASVPAHVRPLGFGTNEDIQVGADVHAIGHPNGESWTYTKGLISQYRLDYMWTTSDVRHQANVVQTQTPINPGNSGGPLLSDEGRLIGINSFMLPGTQGMNFAVSVGDVLGFLKAAAIAAAFPEVCQAKEMFKGRNKSGDGNIVQYDTNCDGKVDLTVLTPDDKSKPYRAAWDRNGDGRIDVVVEDTDRDGKWDISYHDTDNDGIPELIGYHPDGKLQPSRLEKYASADRRTAR